MSVRTNNIYGKIIISDKTIERFVSYVARDCYGIVVSFIKFGKTVKGINVKSNGDKITIEISVVVKYGISIKAVVEALKESVKYRVEKFTGMLVDVINVNVMGVKQ